METSNIIFTQVPGANDHPSSPFQTQGQNVPPPENSSRVDNVPRIRFLYMDTNDIELFVFEKTLKAIGTNMGIDFLVKTTKNGRDGLHLAQSFKPHIIATETLLEELSGLDFIRVCRNVESFNLKKVPILVISADAFAEQQQAGLAAGADAYITKPYDLLEFEAELCRWLWNDLVY